MKNIFVLFLLICSSQLCFAQAGEDSCGITPKYAAGFDGITAKGMLSPEDVLKIKKLKSEDSGVKIIRFTYLIDCGEDCEGGERTVEGDTFSEEDLKLLQGMKSRNVLSLYCLLGKDKKGELVAFKPFLYYIR
ncbi:hypothetical protein LZZ85_15955 [Terrimonas sp. NA20]|uniref:Uncharacterized protein n=1 Tax=Terrimonas ginsenosidimutans TaxID=2908004 RepID=A0ABS9KU25_9BACT|nr:hypothetical protein [Terrimonas ginsenosidimutans]MCG2615795.1 hypothetical protein [Terrimonas ginsenosidimutans]